MENLPQIEHLALFHKVVEAGTLSKVAQSLGVPKATLSRKIRQLEADLGVQLLVRTTRSLSPTELGKKLYASSTRLLQHLTELSQELHDEQTEPQGLLKVTAGVEFGVSVLNRLLAQFQQQCPKVTLDLELTGRVIDLVHENVDVAIRIGPLKDSTLKSRFLGEFSYGLFCSPQFLKENRKHLTGPEGLKALPALVFKTSQRHHGETWALQSGERKLSVKVQAKMIANNHVMLSESAINHQGVYFGPSFLVHEALHRGSLVRVLKDWSSSKIPVHAVFPYQDFMPAHVRALIDYLAVHVSRYLI